MIRRFRRRLHWFGMLKVEEIRELIGHDYDRRIRILRKCFEKVRSEAS